jgi:VWFA-related protein
VTRRRAVALVAMLPVVLAASSVLARSPQQVFRAETNLVTVSVTVLSGRKPVAGLTARDFEVLDNGVPQTIDAASSEALPIDVSLILDVSESVKGRLLDGLKTAVGQVSGFLRPDDTQRLLSVGRSVREIAPAQGGTAKLSVDQLQAGGPTALHDGLLVALMRSGAPDRRQLAIVFTDGLDTFSFATRSTVEAVARRSDVALHMLIVVDDFRTKLDRRNAMLPQDAGTATLAETGVAPRDLDEFFPGQRAFAAITASTGGRLFLMDPKDSIGAAFKETVDNFRRGYVLRYSPRGVALAGWHDITVRVSRPGRYDVRARKGYVGTIPDVASK